VSRGPIRHRPIPFRAVGGRPAVLGIVFVLIMSVLLCACARRVPRTELVEIDEEKIPEPVRHLVDVQLRSAAERGRNPRNLKWRAVDEREDYTFVACTYEWTIRIPGPRPDDPVMEWDEIVAMWIAEDRGLVDSFGAAVDELPPKEPFKVQSMRGKVQSTRGIQGAFLVAHGWCTDPNVEKIVAITSSGAEVETAPVGGFWYVRYEDNDGGETFVRVQALNARGKVVHEASSQPESERPPSKPGS